MIFTLRLLTSGFLTAEPVVIATWPFGKTAVEIAAKLLAAGKPPLDAALAGAQAVEDDGKVHSVGFGGIGNSIGTVSLDACVMDGKTLDCGSVAGVENIRHVAALAKKVYEKTPHVMLVGKGAEWFAIQNGFPLETLLTPESVALWEKERPKKVEPKGTTRSRSSRPPPREHGVSATSDCRTSSPGGSVTRHPSGPGCTDTTRPGRPGHRRRRGDHRIHGASFIVEQMRAGKTRSRRARRRSNG